MNIYLQWSETIINKTSQWQGVGKNNHEERKSVKNAENQVDAPVGQLASVEGWTIVDDSAKQQVVQKHIQLPCQLPQPQQSLVILLTRGRK
jgi:hypothetical protein